MVETLGLNKALGNRLKARREEAHLNQTAVANRVGLSRASISNIENGRQPVTLQTLWLFAQTLGVSLRDLVPDDSEIGQSGRRVTSESEAMWARKVEAGHGHP